MKMRDWLTVRCVTAKVICLQAEDGAVGKGEDYGMSALHLDEAVTGSLDYIFAIPPAVGGGRPDGRALAERDYDPVER